MKVYTAHAPFLTNAERFTSKEKFIQLLMELTQAPRGLVMNKVHSLETMPGTTLEFMGLNVRCDDTNQERITGL